MTPKQRHRAEILSQIEGKRGMANVLIEEARRLAQSLSEEWVVRRRILRQRVSHGGTGAPAGHLSYWGTLNPRTPYFRQGFLFTDPAEEGVKTVKHPETAHIIAQCAADQDRRYDREDFYTIEIVDRVDGEVFCEIPCRSAYIKAIESGVPLSEAAKLLSSNKE